MDKLGLTYTELDLIFTKQRAWWQRVYEPNLCKRSRGELVHFTIQSY